MYACTAAVATEMIVTGGNLGVRSRTCPTATLPTTKPQASYRNRISVSTVRCQPRHSHQYCCHRKLYTLTSKQSVRSALMKLRDTTKLTCFRQARYARIMPRNKKWIPPTCKRCVLWWWKGKSVLIIKYLYFLSSRYVCARFHLHCHHQPFYLRGMDGPPPQKKTLRCRYKTTCGL